MRTRRARHVTVIAIALALSVVAACTGDDGAAPPSSSSTATSVSSSTTSSSASTSSTSTTTGSSSTTTTTSIVPVDRPLPSGLRSVPPFADYRWVPPLGDDGVSPWPPTPGSFDDVLLVPSLSWLEESRQPDAAALVAAIEANGFVIANTWSSRFFHDVFKAAAYSNEPLYVTTDALYHSWHLVFDRVLRDTEQQQLLPILEEFLVDAVAASRTQERDLAGTPLAEDAHRATAFYESAATLLELDVGGINDLAREEVALVEAAAGIESSPITGSGTCEWPDSFVGCIDYTLFLPRGHYNRTPELQRYFRAMSVLGLEGFALAEGVGVVPGLLVTRVILDDPTLMSGWTALYEPTAFLVGLADDIDPFQLATAADRAAPGWRDDPTLLVGVDADAIAESVLDDHPVAIDPERASVRVMGARFTLDSFVLDQLAWPNVGTEDDRRTEVSGLDVAAAFGSPTARGIQLDTQSTFLHYEDQLDAMADLVAAREPSDWAGTVYDAWLVAIQPQFAPKAPVQPDYMRTEAWAAKALQTGLVSYAELKHDTVLYTKQGSAGEGAGPEPPAFEPRNWVEPDPVSFGRIAAAAELLRDGFSDRGLLTEETDDLIGVLIELSTWLAGIAERELRGQVPSDAENGRLWGIGSELEYLWIVASEIELDEYGYAVPDWDEAAALVTDVFTTSFAYLQLGTGEITPMYVIVPLGDGRFELATGAVSSYYEFWRSNSEPRLTDEEWRRMVSDGLTPPRPRWMEPVLVGDEVADEWIVRM